MQKKCHENSDVAEDEKKGVKQQGLWEGYALSLKLLDLEVAFSGRSFLLPRVKGVTSFHLGFLGH